MNSLGVRACFKLGRILDRLSGMAEPDRSTSGAANRHPLPRSNLQFFPRFVDYDQHPTRWNFPAYLRTPGVAWLESLRELYDMPIVFPASLSPEAGMMLHALVRNLRPKVAVETGTFLSVSTHWIASALLESGGGARLFCFDDFGPIPPATWRPEGMSEDRLEWVRARLNRAGFADFISLHRGVSWENLRSMHAELRTAGGVDLAFIDGDHTLKGAVEDFLAVEPVLNTGGYVILHDTFPEACGGHEGPRHLLEYVNSFSQGLYEKLDLYLAPLNYGMGILRRIG